MINFTQFITTLERLTVTKVVFELLLELFQCCRMILTVTKVVFEFDEGFTFRVYE